VSHGFNNFAAEHYGRYLYIKNSSSDFGGPDNGDIFKINPNNLTPYYQNLGYLYPLGLAGDGTIFYCPAYNSKSQPETLDMSAPYYSPLLTSRPGTGGATGSAVRSSFIWNPWSAGAGRLYPKTSSFKAPRVLLFEYLLNETSDTKAPINERTTAHSRSRTLTVAYSDQAVQQVRITAQMMMFCTVGAGNNFSCAPNGGLYPNYASFLGSIEIQH
jgi:hypothetical protein